PLLLEVPDRPVAGGVEDGLVRVENGLTGIGEEAQHHELAPDLRHRGTGVSEPEHGVTPRVVQGARLLRTTVGGGCRTEIRTETGPASERSQCGGSGQANAPGAPTRGVVTYVKGRVRLSRRT